MESPVIPVVLDRHAEEAAFLWLLRSRAVGLPQFNLRSLAELDQRVEAHIDGLRVAGEPGWQRMWKEFEDRSEPGEAFAAAVLAFEGTRTGALRTLLDAADARPPVAAAIASAVGWLTDADAPLALSMLHGWESPAGRRVGIAAAAVRRAPPPGRAADAAFRDPKGLARAIKAAAELGDSSRLHLIRPHLSSADLDVRFAAAFALARLGGDPAAVTELQSIALTESRYRQRSATLAVRRLPHPTARRWAEMLTQTPGCERVGVQAAGALGDAALVPRLVDAMALPQLARLAGEAFCLITGARLTEDRLDRPPPEGFEAGPTDDPDDPLVELDPDDGLDWPDPEKVSKWWSAHKGRLTAGERHVCGRRVTPEHLVAVLRDGYQRQRAAAALELALLRPRDPLFEVRAPGWRQRGGAVGT